MRIGKRFIAKAGDTMIEVMFALSVFALVSVLAIVVMNSGVSTAEATLEISTTRNEIDSQSEVLRFIHNSFLNDREFVQQEYANIWKELKKYINEANSNAILPLALKNGETCEIRYTGSSSENIFAPRKTIILNPRKIDPVTPTNTIISVDRADAKSIFKNTELSPRLIFNNNPGSTGNDSDVHPYEGDTFTSLKSAEGIWVIPIKSGSTLNGVPEFYDFHIYTCWTAPGREYPTTIGTIMRLYNPEMIEVNK